MSFERVGKYLKAHEKDLEQWQEQSKKGEPPMSLVAMAQVLSSRDGIRVGVRMGEQPTGMIIVDLHGDASTISSFARPLFLQVLSDFGVLINDFQSWTFQAQGKEISLAGKLSPTGLRRLLSVVDSPVSDGVAADKAACRKTEAEKSRDYFRAVLGMGDDMKHSMENLKTVAQAGKYCENYAKRIERLPILGVDESFPQYSWFVSDLLRRVSFSVKMTGIQTGVRQAQGSYNTYGYGYGNAYDAAANGRVVRAEGRSVATTDLHQVRATLISVTAEVRRK